MSIANNELKWQLTGIREEKKSYETYLAYLNEQEKIISDRLLTGTAPGVARTTPGRKPTTTKGVTNGTTTTGPVKRRKRVMSPEQRQKMSDAARKRWGKLPEQQGVTTVASAPAAPEIPSTVQ